MALNGGKSFCSSAALALWISGCDTQFADPIRQESGTAPGDPCTAWSTPNDCLADVDNGCSFQPNAVGCHAADASCPAGSCRGGDPFVRRSGETLRLGGKPFRFVGTVSWGVAYDPDGCNISSYPERDQGLTRTFDDLGDMNATVLKIWAFQDFAGASGADYENFEAVVAYARRAGVRLIFVLENMYADCTRGQRTDAWFAGGFREPYGGYALSYSDYVAGLVQHFRDEPTILAWELMHEANGADFAALSTFAGEISSLVRANDPNHLIALGTDNGSSLATDNSGEPSNYQMLHDAPAIDLLDAHDFGPTSAALAPGFPEVRRVGGILRKPVFAGAVAVELADTSGASFQARADAVDAKIVATFAEQFVGFLVYDYYPNWQQPGWSFDARPEEPLSGPNGVIRTRSAALR